MTPAVGKAEQQEQLDRVVRRFAEHGPRPPGRQGRDVTPEQRSTLDEIVTVYRDDYALTFTEEPSKMLHGDWADSDRRVHEYLDRHRDELAALAGQ